MIGVPLLTVLGGRLPRKNMLMAPMGLFIAGDLVPALAENCGLLMGGRVVAALAHGEFFGVGSVVAADLVASASVKVLTSGRRSATDR